MKIIRLGLLIILAASGAGYGDSAPVMGRGETVWPVNNKQIEMTEEKVVITYQLEKDLFFADCMFVLRNTGKATTVKVGFPTDGEYPNYEAIEVEFPKTGYYNKFETKGKFLPYIVDFKTWINGEEIPTEIKLGVQTPSQYSWTYKYYKGAYVWTMRFKAGQTCTVQTTYSLYGTSYKGERGVNYVLKTGKLWKGPIGKAEIVVQGLPMKWRNKPTPGGYEVNENTISWHFKNFEPDTDISVEAYVSNLLWIYRAEQLLKTEKTHSDTLFREMSSYYGIMNYIGTAMPTSRQKMAEIKEKLLARIAEGPEKDYFLYQDCLERGDSTQAVTRWISSLQAKWKGEPRWKAYFGGSNETERFKVLAQPNHERWPQTDSFTRQNAVLNPDTGRYVHCLRAVEEYYQKGGISDLRPQAKDNWQTLGSKYRSVGRFEEALRCYERALNPDQHVREFKGNYPDDPQLFLDMGRTMLLAGDTARATTYIQRAASTTTPWLKKQAVDLLKQIQERQKGVKL